MSSYHISNSHKIKGNEGEKFNLVLVIVLVGALLLSACAPATPVPAVEKADRGKRTLKVWSYTNEFMAMAVAFEMHQMLLHWKPRLPESMLKAISRRT